MTCVPTDWREVSFKEAFERLKLKSFEIPTKEYQATGAYPIIDQGDGEIAGYIDREGPITSVPLIVFGDHTTNVKYVDQPCFIGSQGVVPLKARECYDPYFLYLMLGRTRIPALGYSRHFRELENKTFLLPPLAEQRKIAEILRTWDEAIENAEAELKAKQKRKRGLMQKLLNPSDERAGAVSKEYDTVMLGDIAEFSKGKGLPKSAIVANGRHKCIHYGELFTFYGDRINEVVSRTDESDDAVFSSEGDVLMPTSDVTPDGLAKASCVLENGVILGGDIMVIRPDKGRAHPPFLSTYIRFKKKEVLRLAKGTTVFHLYGSDMAKFLVQLPPLAEQCKIAQVLQSEDAAIDSLKIKADLLRTQKRGLMQKLLTGEVRVAA
jgi:type I restriction enzyme S subunit